MPSRPATHLDRLDRASILFLTLPLLIFLAGWFQWWLALPAIVGAAYTMRGVFAAKLRAPNRHAITATHVALALVASVVWVTLSGAGHLVYTNADWHLREAVLHDLVASAWPVGYGPLDGWDSVLRAPLAYYLPAALVGKAAGIPVALAAMAVWTAIGTFCFLLLALSLTGRGWKASVITVTIVIFFSGMDIVGSSLSGGQRFFHHADITTHLEWWAVFFQYSSLTTQLFWVPNHAIGGWLLVGLLMRHADDRDFDHLLPVLLIALALWSPLTTIGVLPFVVWKIGRHVRAEFSARPWNPYGALPVLLAAALVATYLALDLGRVPGGSVLPSGMSSASYLLRHAQFFLLEAGLLGIALLRLDRSAEMVIALVVLALLPAVHFGPGNDLVMRASIPSLLVLALTCARVLTATPVPGDVLKRAVIVAILAIGAVTPITEMGRALLLPRWEANTNATVVAADCGNYPAHYIARLTSPVARQILLPPHPVAAAEDACRNPAVALLTLHNIEQMLRNEPAEHVERNR